MKIPENIWQILSEEWAKLSGYVKISIIIIVILDVLIIYPLKTEFNSLIGRVFPGFENESLFLSVIAIIPISVFIISYLIHSVRNRKGRQQLNNITSTPKDNTPNKIDEPDHIPKKYQIIRQISSSQISSVYIAREIALNHKVILKWIRKPELCSNLEIPRSSGLSLPIEVFNENAFRYEVLNYYDGWTLAEIIETNQGNQFGVTACLLHDWTTQLLSLLSTLHKSGIIHRDINPSNILVLRDSLELVLLDFSSAIKYSSKPQIPIGRFGYTPDEQIQGRATPASDVYAAGMVIYSMNSCKPPPVSSARLHRDFPELKIEMYTPLTNIEKVFQRMIELDPQKRYPNALEASSEIRLPDTLMGPFIPDILKLPSGDVVEMTELSWTYTRGDGITIRQQIG